VIKRTLILSIIIFTFFLSSCVGIGFNNICKANTAWASADNRLVFQMQGHNASDGFGRIEINGEAVAVTATLDHVAQKLALCMRSGEKTKELILFKISLYGEGFKKEEDRIKVTMIINNSDDDSYDGSFALYRRDLRAEEIDAKHYANTAWVNGEFGMQLLPDAISDFTKILRGTIKYREINLTIAFHFLDDREFEVYAAEELVLAGTYETEDLEMILHFTVNEIYDVNTLTLSVMTDH
jgi:hypothetical protein